MADSCATCHKAPSASLPLKRCAKCLRGADTKAWYCSRECQKADWKTHKTVCGRTGAGASSSSSSSTSTNTNTNTNNNNGLRISSPRDAATNVSPPKGVDAGITKPFNRLDNGTWLHRRSEKDVFRLLIDAYRMRVEDDYTMAGDVDADSLYGGAPDGRAGFRRFVRLASKKMGLLPAWWTAAKANQAVAFGMRDEPDAWQDLRCAIEKSDVFEHYGDSQFPMQLRMFAQAVYGDGPGAQDGTAMRRLMMTMEGGGGRYGPNSAIGTFDMASLLGGLR
jgi:mitochondrial splicing suppressor protein 51